MTVKRPTKREEILHFLTHNVIWKVAPTEKLIEEMVRKYLDRRYMRSAWFNEPRHYPR